LVEVGSVMLCACGCVTMWLQNA